MPPGAREAVDASYAVDKTFDEDDLTTGGSLVKQEPKDGWTVNVDEIKETAKNQIEARNFAPFEAQVEVIKGSAEAPQGNWCLWALATTTVSGSAARKYNVWKMSDILNGAVFKPGEVFSINDTAGDRTLESDGRRLRESKTVPIRTSRAAVSARFRPLCITPRSRQRWILWRVPHTIMAKYVPKGWTRRSPRAALTSRLKIRTSRIW